MKTNLKRIRESQGKLQDEVARDLDMSLSTYRSWEQGQRNLNGAKLSLLADYFGVTVDTIIGSHFEGVIADPQYTVHATDLEIKIFESVKELSPDGQERVCQYIFDLIASGRYRKSEVPDNPVRDVEEAIA